MKPAFSLIAFISVLITPALAAVTVSSPANNSTVSSPVHYAATASSTCSKGVSSIGLYVNNQRVFVQNGTNLDYNLSLANGTYSTVVQEWDGCGGSTTAPIQITVQSSSTTSVNMTASPASITAGGASVLAVTASNATQVTIQGSDGSSYTLSADGGNQTVTPKATTTYTATAAGASGSVTSTATVTVSAAPATGVIVSSPANNSTVSSPVHYAATASSACSKGVSAMGLYVNNQQVVVQNGASLNYNLTLVNGSYSTVVQEWDGCGGSTTAPIQITVQSTSATSVNMTASPASIATGGASVLAVTASNATQVTIKGSDGSSYTLSAGGGNQTVTPTATTTYTATATGASGSVTSTATVTVGSSNTTVNVSSPTNNSTVTSPVTFSATASTAACAQGIAAMGVYVDNNLAYKVNGSAIQTSLTIAAGNHFTVVQAWDNCGGAIKTPVSITVKSGSAAAVSITASPSAINVGGSSALTVSATNAAQLKINGSDGSSYSLPQSGGTQSVSPQASTTYTATATDSAGATTTALTAVTVNPLSGGSPVLMHRNDLAGDGANLNEVTLTPSNVNSVSFGRKYALPVDGQLYAQPLYVPGLSVNGATHNVVFAATQNDSVYAFDADSGSQLWKVSVGTPVSNNDPEGVQPTLGILSTPVIDASTNTMYVTAVTSGNVMKLHALDITSGAEKFGGPVTVKASVPGTGNGNVNGIVPLSGGCYERTSLTLANGRIYLGFGHCNHGWILAYDSSTLAQTQVLNTSPDGVGATIWMGGAGPVVDANGDLYVITADDIGSSAPSGNDFPDAILKLSPSLQVLDSFIPSNERYLEGNDADLGSGAPILLPNNNSAFPHELIGGGKDGRVFVVNRDNMGGYQKGANAGDNVIQTVQTGTQQFDNIWGAPGFWNGTVFYHTEGDVLKAYSWSGGKISTKPFASANHVYFNHGASPSISANGTSNGIVWDVDNSGYPSTGGSGGTPAILHAYDASNITQELYNSSLAPNGRDTAGHACKFSVPTVTDGKVFVPTCTELDIYGLLP
jgi:hypothetical protein